MNNILICFIDEYDDWIRDYHHAGFDIVSNRILEVLEEYITTYSSNFKDDRCFWVTGHSMGGGVANLVGASLVDGYCDGNSDNVYCYTFASPNTFYRIDNNEDDYREPHGVKYRCIFNIVNDDDFVPKLPMEECEWTKYGRTAKRSINDSKFIMYNNYTNYRIGTVERYISDQYYTKPKSIEKIITEFTNLYNDKNNMRQESYEFIEDGESSFADYDYEDNLKEVVAYYAKPYQKYSWEQCSTGEYYYRQKQMPAYFMQTLTNSLHYAGRKFDGTIDTNEETGEILDKRADNKLKFALFIPLRKIANLKTKFLIDEGMFKIIDYPHYVESYYYLTKNINTVDFD